MSVNFTCNLNLFLPPFFLLGLSRGKTLLLQVLDVMAGYLRISPLVFVYAGFDVGKLLTSSTALSASTEEVDVALWKKILVLLSSAPKGTLKWYHQVCT